MIAASIGVGLGLLFAGGTYYTATKDTGEDPVSDHLVSEGAATLAPGDLSDPGAVLSDGRKLRSVAVVAVEAALAVAAIAGTAVVLARPSVALGVKLIAVGTMVLGIGLVGRAAYTRLGLDGPVDPVVAATQAFGDDGDFTAARSALASARGDEVEGGSEATAAVIAAARNDAAVEDIEEFAARADIDADADIVRERVEQLTEAGVVDREGDTVSVGPALGEASPDQLAGVAASVAE